MITTTQIEMALGHVNDPDLGRSLTELGMIENIKIDGMKKEDVIDKCFDRTFNGYEAKIAPYKEQVLPIEKTMVLRVIDRAWINHIDIMAKLREGIHLRSYAQNNPLQAYVQEGYDLFESMMNTISSDVVTFCNNVKVVKKGEK